MSIQRYATQPLAKKAKTEAAKPKTTSGGIRKDFYVEGAAVKARSPADVEKWRKQNVCWVCPFLTRLG